LTFFRNARLKEEAEQTRIALLAESNKELGIEKQLHLAGEMQKESLASFALQRNAANKEISQLQKQVKPALPIKNNDILWRASVLPGTSVVVNITTCLFPIESQLSGHEARQKCCSIKVEHLGQRVLNIIA